MQPGAGEVQIGGTVPWKPALGAVWASVAHVRLSLAPSTGPHTPHRTLILDRARRSPTTSWSHSLVIGAEGLLDAL